MHFSNHTGHPNGFQGTIMNGDQLSLILKGLEDNNLLHNIHHLLTGYIGSKSFLHSVLNVLQTLKKYNSNLRYVCDPVLGDDGRVYVPQELVEVYRNEVIPLANVVTPNHFEAELLTGIKIKTIDDAKNACRILHDLGPDLVVITSLVLLDSENSINSCNEEESITILASQNIHKTKEVAMWTVSTPKIPGRFTGTGDVTTALLLAWTAKMEYDLKLTLEYVASTMYTLIKATAEQATTGSVASKELRLIQCKKVIENPTIIFEATKLL